MLILPTLGVLQCDPPPLVDNARHIPVLQNYSLGTQVFYKCTSFGYTSAEVGHDSLYCREEDGNAFWKGNEPSCVLSIGTSKCLHITQTEETHDSNVWHLSRPRY